MLPDSEKARRARAHAAYVRQTHPAMERDLIAGLGVVDRNGKSLIGVLRIADSSGVDDQHGTIVRRSVSVANR